MTDGGTVIALADAPSLRASSADDLPVPYDHDAALAYALAPPDLFEPEEERDAEPLVQRLRSRVLAATVPRPSSGSERAPLTQP